MQDGSAPRCDGHAPSAPTRCSACVVRDTGLCAAFSDSEIAPLHAIARQRMARAGQILTWAGDPAAICATVVSGVLKIVRDDAAGRSHIAGLLFPGDLVGEPFEPGARDTIIVLSDAELCVYPREALATLLDDHPAAVRQLLRRAFDTLNDARRFMLMLARRDAREKVAGFLLDMAGRTTRAGDDMLMLPMGRSEIGELLGLTIETVSRQMTALARAGLIGLPGGRAVQLKDRDGLRALAG
ncbi:hypothetical protein NX02_08630 [Sphingomonas sanxanigenens DSM 19645 = NX02]|uniref:HTH crp-type domain-containing protein n=1 Tax=Sphingomonas sanxanigenens DSM 19645 = NX02 TaxID=1123269 RepID=W0A661_9SPHN|nr:hypothetical protein NX02_08630 [Sphingomonas sanxanigenens DSM 19645 = NX02]